MYLRQLRREDAPFMLEWMHDANVTRALRTNFASMTIENCLSFINKSMDSSENAHFAIAGDADEYLGTVSLKNIHNNSAEFAITIRSSAMGKGIAKEAMAEIIRKGFEENNLEEIYWGVAPSNKRAIRFYEKNGYIRVYPSTLGIAGGVQRITNSLILLVPHHENGKEERNLLKLQQKIDILFLCSVA